MKKKKRRVWFWLAGVVIVIILAHELILIWKTSRVEQELADVNHFAQCCNGTQISYTKKRGIFSNIFELSSQLEYVVVPFWPSYYFKGVVSFDSSEYKAFPEDLLKKMTAYGNYVYPKDDVVEKEIPEHAASFFLSFDRPYTISEVMSQKSLYKASWFWVDTYRDCTDYAECYVRDVRKPNTAYGITASQEELALEAEKWITMLNQYNSSVSTKIGKRIMGVKHGISDEDTISLEDIKIIGCETELSNEEQQEVLENPMVRVIQ